jgi:hypothetical protein
MARGPGLRPRPSDAEPGHRRPSRGRCEVDGTGARPAADADRWGGDREGSAAATRRSPRVRSRGEREAGARARGLSLTRQVRASDTARASRYRHPRSCRWRAGAARMDHRVRRVPRPSSPPPAGATSQPHTRNHPGRCMSVRDDTRSIRRAGDDTLPIADAGPAQARPCVAAVSARCARARCAADARSSADADDCYELDPTRPDAT